MSYSTFKIVTIFLLVFLTSCSKVIYLEEGLRKHNSVAFLRSGPKVIINNIDSIKTNESIGRRNSDWGNSHYELSFNCGKFYAVKPGMHTIHVTYSGLYTHTNPPYPYYKKTIHGLIGPKYRRTPQLLAIKMISADTKLVQANLLPNHQYEARVYLKFSEFKESFLPEIPKYISPLDTTIIIDPVVAGYIPPHLDELCISNFDWEVCIVDLGAIEDTCGESMELEIQNAMARSRSDYTMLLLSTYGENEYESIKEITSLHRAARGGDSVLTNALIVRDFDVNAKTKLGMTPLHLAAENGHLNITKMLISADANVNAGNNMNATPLFYASGNGHTEIANFLINSGADINEAQKIDWRPIHHAVHGGHLETTKLLISQGAQIDAQTDIGLTPLIISVNEGHPEIMKLLLTSRANCDRCDKEGWTPLHYAALNGESGMIVELLNSGASPCLPNKRFCTPLHNSALKDDTISLKLLLDAGCNINAKTSNGWTPLHMAASNECVDAVNLLIREGAKINARTDNDETPLFLARRAKNVFCIDALKKHNAME